jgi:hypothetical protein
MIYPIENGQPEIPLTCNRCRSTGNIANSTTAHNIKANTEMSSGNREASTTEADNAALIESTDVRLQNDNGQKMMPRAPWK